jgi:thymidine kinase
LAAFQGKIEESRLYSSILGRCSEGIEREMLMNSLKVPLIAERALIYLYAEQNLLSEEQMRFFIQKLDLDRDYLSKRLADNRRPLAL